MWKNGKVKDNQHLLNWYISFIVEPLWLGKFMQFFYKIFVIMCHILNIQYFFKVLTIYSLFRFCCAKWSQIIFVTAQFSPNTFPYIYLYLKNMNKSYITLISHSSYLHSYYLFLKCSVRFYLIYLENKEYFLWILPFDNIFLNKPTPFFYADNHLY